jgi:uronate dehydrogenase
MYGVSDNARSWYDNSNAHGLGYKPGGKAEDHKEAAMAAQAKLAPDPVGDFYQGGTFCAAEYSADFERMKSRS